MDYNNRVVGEQENVVETKQSRQIIGMLIERV
jgi:hypothetical protein